MEKTSSGIKDAIVGTFDRSAKNYDRLGPRYFTHFGQRLVELAGLGSGEKVLDVATGRGAVLIPAAHRVGPNGRVTGIDLSTEMVGEAIRDLRSAGLANVDIRKMDAEALEYPDASFDWVLCGFSLWFFPQPDRALAEIHRVLRRGGRIGLTTWDRESQHPGRFRRLIQSHIHTQPDKVTAPKRFDTRPELLSALKDVGFDQIDVKLDEADLVYESEEVIWESLWAAGMRRLIEQVQPADRDKLKAAISDEVRAATRSDGVHVKFRALVAFGVKR